MRIFLAGATGVIGQALVPLMRDAGHAVTGMTRTAKARLDWKPSASMVWSSMCSIALPLSRLSRPAPPEVLISQITDLSKDGNPSGDEEFKYDARIRREGTANLARAARSSRVNCMIAQSMAWAYAPKTPPFVETDPLDHGATGARAISVSQGVAPLEAAVLDREAFEGVVPRYGQLNGPGAWSLEPSGASPMQVDTAAYAALLAVDYEEPGAYNIADPAGAVSIDKAVRALGWRPDFRLERRT